MTLDTNAMCGEKQRQAPTLLVGAAIRDITPPLGVGLLMSSVDGRWAAFEGVRRELSARAVVMIGESASGAVERVAVIALDLLALSGETLGGFAEFKSRVAAAAENCVTPGEIVLTCTHTHSAPESGGLTELHKTPDFTEWLSYLIGQIGTAIKSARDNAVPCQVSYGASTLPGLGIHRRFKTTKGIMMSHPEPPADVVVSRDGAVDDSVNVIAFRDIEGTLKAIIVNATCHPVYEMCIPQVSPDYPGELTSMLDEQHPGVVTAFLNGAAGNVNPQTVSSGPSESRRHAESLAAIVNTILKKSTVEPTPHLALSRSACLLATRLPKGEDIGITLTATISALHIGATAIVFIPGEPFAETALAIRQASVFELTAIVGFSEESIGYIPTDQAFAEGGYEAGFGKWSMLSPGSEVRIQRDSLSLLENLVTGEYERLAPTVPMPLGGANVTIESSPEGRRTSTVRRGGR